MSRLVHVALGLLLAVTAAWAEPYWVEYDPPDGASGDQWLPEVCGWQRCFGNEHGGTPGDLRWIENGCLVIDSRSDQWSYDFAKRSQLIDPGPGEVFVAEWRFLLADNLGYGDTSITFAGDVNEEIVYTFRLNRIFSLYEQWQYFFAAGGFHTFRLESPYVWDTAPYHMWIDGELVRIGYWSGPTLNHSSASFGDSWVAGDSGSLCYWDYFRFGVVPATYLGDVNCDGALDFADIDAFVLAISDWPSYEGDFPECNIISADINRDGVIDFDDINPFVECLSGQTFP